jgi:enoyl-CoA hydratase/carnithine racemase
MMTVLGALPNVVAPFGKPVIAALHGHVLGMGLNLALHCDIRIGHPDMRLGFPEIHHGMISAAGAVVLPSVVGVSRALEMLLLGDSIPAEAAKEIGIVSHLAEDPRSVAREMATRIARFDPRAVRASLRLARLGAGPASARFVDEMRQARDSLEDPI